MRRQFETLESRTLLSVTPFGAPVSLVSSPIREPETIEVADVDGDGLNDLFLGTYGGIQWIRQTADGFAPPSEVFGPRGSRLGDLNGDGALDVVGLSFRGLVTLLNDGRGHFQQVAWNDRLTMARDGATLNLADLDHDGDLDAAFIARNIGARNSGFGWAANDGQGNFGEFQQLFPLNDVFVGHFSDVAIGDIDGDGDFDAAVVDRVTGRFPQRVVWYENTPNGYVVRRVAISMEPDREAKVELMDVTGDGQLNLIVTNPSNTPVVVVAERNASDQTFVPLPEFGMGAGATQMEFADLDLDGDLDVVRSRGTRLEWFARGPDGQFPTDGVSIATLDDEIDGFSVGDVDRDGLPDVALVSSAFDRVAYYRNTGTGAFTQQQISVSALDEVEQVLAGDFNGDQKVDLVTRGRHLSWLPATDGAGHFADPIDLLDREIVSLRLRDLDGDQDLDIAASDEASLYLLLNDGSGGVTSQILGRGGNIVSDVDWDGDGDLDLITTGSRYSEDGAMLWWYRNDGGGVFSPALLLADLNQHPVFHPFDFGDDLISLNTIVSLRRVSVQDSRMKLGLLVEQGVLDTWGVFLVGTNTDGTVVTSPTVVQIRADDTQMGFAVADTDDDGFDEIISVLDYYDSDVLSRRQWFDVMTDAVVERPFEQLAASVDTEQLRTIEYVAERGEWLWFVTNNLHYDPVWRFIRHDFYADTPLEFADLNGDGQLDMFSAWDADVYWAENLTRQRDWNQDQLVTAADVDLLAAAILRGEDSIEFDVDQDQAVTHQDLEALVQDQMHSHLADVNLDGVFDSSDLVLLFQAGKYESYQAALWSEGDFNGDGKFDSSDLAVALSLGY